MTTGFFESLNFVAVNLSDLAQVDSSRQAIKDWPTRGYLDLNFLDRRNLDRNDRPVSYRADCGRVRSRDGPLSGRAMVWHRC